MRRLWTLVSAVGVFALMLAVVLAAPTNYVLWSPGEPAALVGQGLDHPDLTISGAVTASPSGRILAPSLRQSDPGARVGLGAVVAYHLLPDHDALLTDTVPATGPSADEGDDASHQAEESAQEEALAAGVRQAGVPVVERPKVVAVRPNGPADTLLYPGDFVLAIDDTPVATADDVRSEIRHKQIGDQVVVTVLRAGIELTVTVPTLVGSSPDGTIPTTGTTLGTGYSYQPRIDLAIPGQSQADPAQGLALALAAYDLLTPDDDLTAGRRVAAIGQISQTGGVSPVPAVNEQASSAEKAGASVLLIPRGNCADLSSSFPDMEVLPVVTLSEAIAALGESDPADWGHC